MLRKKALTERQMVELGLGEAFADSLNGLSLVRRFLKMEPLNAGEDPIQDDPKSESCESDLH